MKRCSILLVIACMCAQSLQLCPTPCNPVDCSLPASYDHVILQAGILEWVAMPFSGGSDGKASGCNAGNLGLIPGSGRSPGDLPSRRKWQPTPAFLPEKSHDQRSLIGYSPWDRKESDTTKKLHFHFHFPLGKLPNTGNKPASPELRCGWILYHWATREATVSH